VDRSTRWPEVIFLKGVTTEDCVEAFFAGWVSGFGIPSTVTLDRGVQLTSAVWKNMCSQLGIQHKLTTAYQPQPNGMVERIHRQLKASLRARLIDQQWMVHLPWVLLGLRAALKEE
jgi:transposase InsO family protein